MINPGYDGMLQELKDHLDSQGFVSLQEILAQPVDLPNTFKEDYQPTLHRYAKTSVVLDKEVSLFIKQLIGASIVDMDCIELSHKSFELRKEIEKKGYMIILDLYNDLPQDVGGDVFHVDASDEALIVPSTPNTLTIIKVQPQDQHFITYVNHYAQDNERLILRTFVYE